MKSSYRPVAIWIGIGIIMLIIQVVLGGVTRLTGSGLSITEWNVITGTIPPLTENAWLTEFHKYQQTPQYQLLNTNFTLADFKFIFFWEWLHRFWARLIGVVFIIGFIYLLAKRYLKTEMIQPLITLFLLGALQGSFLQFIKCQVHSLEGGFQNVDPVYLFMIHLCHTISHRMLFDINP